MAQHCLWSHMDPNFRVPSFDCKLCMLIGKNLRSIIVAKQFQVHKLCMVHNLEKLIGFAGP